MASFLFTLGNGRFEQSSFLMYIFQNWCARIYSDWDLPYNLCFFERLTIEFTLTPKFPSANASFPSALV